MLSLARNILYGALKTNAVSRVFESTSFDEALKRASERALDRVTLPHPRSVISHWENSERTIRKVCISWEDPEEEVIYSLHFKLRKVGKNISVEEVCHETL